jgi:hypothetical protein
MAVDGLQIPLNEMTAKQMIDRGLIKLDPAGKKTKHLVGHLDVTIGTNALRVSQEVSSTDFD